MPLYNPPVDVTAIHTDGTAEISVIAEKVAPAATDVVVLEDSGVGYIKKRAQVTNIKTPLATVAPADVTKALAVIGGSSEAAKADHKHDVSVGTPGTTTFATADPGAATSLARSDHTHGVTAPTAPANVTKAAADPGASANFARQDHKHDIGTAAPSANAVVIGAAATDGSLSTLARSDHLHTVTGGSPVAVGTANSDGAATTFARSNHVHAGLTRDAADFGTFAEKSPVGTTDILLIEDTGAANVKKKIQVGNIPSSGATIVAAVDTTTRNAATDAIVTGTGASMTTTPVAGVYLVLFSGSITNNTNGGTTYCSIWYNGLQITSSEQRYYRNGNQQQTVPFCCVARVTAAGGIAVEGRWRVGTAGNVGTMYQRNLLLHKVS